MSESNISALHTPSSISVEQNSVLHSSKTLETVGAFTDFDTYRVTGIASITGLLCLTLICNGLLLASVRSSQRFCPKGRTSRLPNVDTLLVVIASMSICNVVLSAPFQLVSFVRGYWDFGDPICQLQGFVTNLLNFCVIWYIALLSFERYTHRLQPQEYPLTLSRLNLKVILIGIFFLLLTAVSGPIYGWGQYSYISTLGLCSLHMTSHNIVTYLSLSMAVYVFLPYIASSIWYTLLVVKPELSVNLLPKDDSTSIFEGRFNIYIFALATLLSLSFGLPCYVTNILECQGHEIDPVVILVFWWLHSFSLNCCFTLSCMCLCPKLRFHICRTILCSLKTKCRHWHLPFSESDHLSPFSTESA